MPHNPPRTKTNDKMAPVLMNLDSSETPVGQDDPLASGAAAGLMGFVAFPGEEREIVGATLG